ncbi:MAG: TonB-dependent receptor plug domain-containing protein [Bacteroidales bacterium]|nr:TonB-dependent receptor plug domain-containing protein [Bacteroidales bacterium]
MKTHYLCTAMLVLSSLNGAVAQETAVADSNSVRTIVRRIDEVTVTGKTSEIESVQMGRSIVTGQQVAMTPSLAGLPDVMTTIRSIPGVSMGREGNSAIWVRGGNRGQNLILFDGIKIYNSNHYYGLASLFNGDVIGKADVYKGSFPASYGGRASSVIDITSVEPDHEDRHFKGALGTMTSSLFFSTPVNDRLSLYVAGRTTYYNLVRKFTMEENEASNFTFYDLNGKLTYRLSDRQQLSLSAFSGYDYNYFEDNDYDKYYDGQKIRNGGISLSHQFVSGPYLWKTTFSISNYRNTFNYDNIYQDKPQAGVIPTIQEKSSISTRLRDMTLRSSLDIDAGRHQLNTGLEVTGTKASPFLTHTINIEHMKIVGDTVTGFVHDKRALEMAVYGSDEFRVNDALSVMAGLRLCGNVVRDTSYFGIEPRFSIRYKLSPQSSIKANYTMMRQYMHNINQLSSSNEMDMWMPSSKKIKPETAQQVSLGYFWNGGGVLAFSAEVFYKKMKNLIDYRNSSSSLFMITSEEISRSILLNGIGRSYGLEISSAINFDNVTVNASYTLSRSERKFSEINRGHWFTDYFDRTHDLSVSALWRINTNWSLSGNFNLMSGTLVTIPECQVTGCVADYVYISKINNCRLPLYHRLDLGLHYERELRNHHRLGVAFNLYNVYCQKNATTVDVSPSGGKLWKDCIFPTIVPTITVTYTL